jgi:hypothetical protein
VLSQSLGLKKRSWLGHGGGDEGTPGFRTASAQTISVVPFLPLPCRVFFLTRAPGEGIEGSRRPIEREMDTAATAQHQDLKDPIKEEIKAAEQSFLTTMINLLLSTIEQQFMQALGINIPTPHTDTNANPNSITLPFKL